MKRNAMTNLMLVAAICLSFVGQSAQAGAGLYTKGKYCTTGEWAAVIDQLKAAMSSNHDSTCVQPLNDALRAIKKDIMPTLSQGGRTLVFPGPNNSKIKVDISVTGYYPGPIDVLAVLGNPAGLAGCL